MCAKHAYYPGDMPVSGYRLIEPMGRGNFGEVWRASAPGGMEVALKIINLSGREGAKEFEALQRVKHIRHTNLVPLFAAWLLTDEGQILDDQASSATTQLLKNRSSGRPAGQDPRGSRAFRLSALIMAMGLGSRTLAQRLDECLAEGKPGIPREELLDAMEGAARGIDYLNQPIHDLGEGPVPIIHGDIKPQNILMVGDGVQVCDFGLARAVESLRKTSTGMGTFAYAAPELLDGKACRSSDQYCLAVTYFELCTGELPFSETNPLRVVELHRRGELDLSKLPLQERDVIRRATSVDPNKRWPTCLAMVRALARVNELGRSDSRSEVGEVVADYPAGPESATSQPLGGTAVVKPIAAPSTVRPTAAGSALETVPGVSGEPASPPGSQRAIPRLQRRWLRWSAAAIVSSLLLGIVAYFVAFSSPPEQRIERLISQDEIQRAFSLAETLYEDPGRKEKLIDHAIKCWNNRVDELVKQRDYVAAMRDVKDAPALKILDSIREEMRHTVFDAWSKRIEKSIAENHFAEAFATFGESASQFGNLGEIVLGKVYESWSRQIQALARANEFADAIRVWQELPDAIKQASPAHWCEPLQYVREVWAGRMSELSNEHSFHKLIEVWEAGLAAWRVEKQSKKLLAEATEHWSTHVNEFLVAHKFAEAFDFASKMPERYDEKNLRKDVVRAWREYVLALGTQNQFGNALKALDEVPTASVPAEERRRLSNDLKTVWSKKIESLGAEGRFPETLQLLKQAYPDWETGEIKLSLKTVWSKKVESLGAERRFPEALQLLKQTPPDWETGEIDLSLRTIWSKKVEDLGTKAQFSEAWQLLEQADSGWESKKTELLGQLRTSLMGRIDRFVEKKQYQGARDLIDKVEKEAPSLFAGTDVESRRATIQKAIAEPGETESRLATIESLIVSVKPTEVGDAIRLAGVLKSRNLTPAQADRLCKVFERPSSKDQLDVVMDAIRTHYVEFFESVKSAAVLAKLWAKRIRISIKEGDKELAKTFELFEKDVKERRLAWPPDMAADQRLADVWQKECLLESGKLDNQRSPFKPKDLPSDMVWYGHYVTARCLEATGGDSPEWYAIAEELPEAALVPAGVADVLERKGKAEGLAIRCAAGILEKQDATGRLLGSPFSVEGDAERCYALLHGIARNRLLRQKDANKARIILALAAFHKKLPDLETGSTLTAELAESKDDKLNERAGEILFAYLRTHIGVVAKANSKDQTAALTACMRLCRLLKEKDATISDDDAKTLCQEVLAPLLAWLEKTKPNDADEKIRRLSFYDGVYDLLSSPNHKELSWPRETNKWSEELLTRAIVLDESLGAAIPVSDSLASRRPNRYYDRAIIRLDQHKPDFDSSIKDLGRVLELKPATQDVPRVQGTLCRSYRARAETQLKAEDQRDDLTAAIKSGTKAIELCPEGSDDLATYLVYRSCAGLERANCSRATRSSADEDLSLARNDAEKAERLNKSLKQKDPDFPFLALGNAWEDIAWLMEHDPEGSYDNAIKAFESAKIKRFLSARASCGIGRCYYRMVVETCLYPGVRNRPNRKELMQKCENELKNAVKNALPEELDAVIARRWLGSVYQRQEQYEKADGYYKEAKKMAGDQKLASQAIYVAYWARLPLFSPSLQPDALSRVKDLLAMPPVPGAVVVPAKEEAWIRATDAKNKGNFSGAIEICGKQLPEDREQANREDFALLILRARCEYEIGSPPANDASKMKDAIADASRAAALALQRNQIAEALAVEAEAHFRSYLIDNTNEIELEKSIEKYKEAAEKAPGRPESAEYCALAARLLEARIDNQSPKPRDQFTLYSEEIDLLYQCCEWVDNPEELAVFKGQKPEDILIQRLRKAMGVGDKLLDDRTLAKEVEKSVASWEKYLTPDPPKRPKDIRLPLPLPYHIPEKISGYSECLTELNKLRENLKGKTQ